MRLYFSIAILRNLSALNEEVPPVVFSQLVMARHITIAVDAFPALWICILDYVQDQRKRGWRLLV